MIKGLPLFAVSCALVFAASALAAPQTQRDVEQEHRLRYISDEFDELLLRSDALIEDPVLVAYLQGVLDRLFPEHVGEMTVRLHRDSSTNAFAMQNGSIYVNAGMLARLTDEAQLAMVLGHEGEHYLQRHAVRKMLSTKGNAAVGAVFGLAIGAPIAGDLLAGSSIAGFSRARERDADRLGFARVQRAGYATDGAHISFERMAREAKAMGRHAGGGIFGSHPRLSQRVSSLQALAKPGDSDGARNREDYLNQTGAVRLAALADQLERQRHDALLVLLEDEDVIASYPAAARYYLAEAYRKRGDEGDDDRVMTSYRIAVEQDPEFAPAWRGLGLYHLRRGERADALHAFERFLALAPEATDRAFIERYIEQLQGADQ